MNKSEKEEAVLKFSPVERFGRLDYAPANSKAKQLTEWLGKKSLSKLTVNALIDIGFRVKVVTSVTIR